MGCKDKVGGEDTDDRLEMKLKKGTLSLMVLKMVICSQLELLIQSESRLVHLGDSETTLSISTRNGRR